jgi:hypothetical protein
MVSPMDFNYPGESSRYLCTELLYKILRGYYPLSGPDEYFIFPPVYPPGPFYFSGDPVTRTGFYDGNDYDYGHLNFSHGGDRRFVMAFGPFSLKYHESLEIVYAIVGGVGADNLSSITQMKHNAQWAKQLVDSGFEIGFADESTPEQVIVSIPLDFYMRPVYPNPFNAETSIGFHLPFDMDIRLTVYDARGRVVRALHDGGLAAGAHSVQWDGKEDSGQSVASGVYICRLEADRWVQSRKMVLLQ